MLIACCFGMFSRWKKDCLEHIFYAPRPGSNAFRAYKTCSKHSIGAQFFSFKTGCFEQIFQPPTLVSNAFRSYRTSLRHNVYNAFPFSKRAVLNIFFSTKTGFNCIRNILIMLITCCLSIFFSYKTDRFKHNVSIHRRVSVAFITYKLCLKYSVQAYFSLTKQTF